MEPSLAFICIQRVSEIDRKSSFDLRLLNTHWYLQTIIVLFSQKLTKITINILPNCTKLEN